MAKLTPARVSAFGLRILGASDCDFCGQEGEGVYWELRSAPDARAKRVTLCIECMLSAVESATGFGFVNQWKQWTRMSGLLKAEGTLAPKGKRHHDKT